MWPLALAASGLAILALIALAGGWLAPMPASLIAGAAVVLTAVVAFLGLRSGQNSRARLLSEAALTSPDGLFITDPAGAVTFANAACARLLGFKPVSLAEIISVCIDSAAATALAEMLESAGSSACAEAQICVRLSDARLRHLRLRTHAVAAERRTLVWYAFEVPDTGGEEKSDEAGEADALNAFNRLPAGAYTIDRHSRFVSVNDTFADWVGLEVPALLQGMGLSDVFGEDAEKLLAGNNGATISTSARLNRGDTEMLVHILQSGGRDEGDGLISTAIVNDLGNLADIGDDAGTAVQNFKGFFETAPTPIVMIDESHLVIDVNGAFRGLLPKGQRIRGHKLQEFFEADDHGLLTNFLDHGWQDHVSGDPLDLRLISGDDYRQVEVFSSGISSIGDEQQGLLLHMVDTTQQRALELQFAQSQKMQAVGQLAGGVAHDFNNLLTAIIGHCDLLLLKTRPGDESFPDIMQIKQNGNRAANLVRQLLAFSRQQTLRPKVLSLTDVLAELTHLIRRLIGENIQLRMEYSRDLWLVKVDQGQFEQVIINLAVNARDAMADGGTLEVKTRNVGRAEVAALRNDLLRPDDYVLVEVADSGKGIKKEDLGRIFEPFFTTKGPGAGTGLGLSTVFGIVKQTGGYVFPHSEVGAGTTFSIYLPVHERNAQVEAEVDEEDAESGPDLTGIGTLLLVEDEDAVRMFAVRALRNKGYTVLEAESGEAALEVFEEHGGDIDLLISDVVMPNMDGPTLMREIHKERPELKVIFISGYAEDAFRKNLDPGAEFELLPKPFSLKQLAAKVKEVLGN